MNIMNTHHSNVDSATCKIIMEWTVCIVKLHLYHLQETWQQAWSGLIALFVSCRKCGWQILYDFTLEDGSWQISIPPTRWWPASQIISWLLQILTFYCSVDSSWFLCSKLSFRRLRFSSDADIVRLTNARIIIIAYNVLVRKHFALLLCMHRKVVCCTF